MTGTEEATTDLAALEAEIDEAVVNLDIEAPEEEKEPEAEPEAPAEDTPEEGEEKPADQAEEESEKSDEEPQGEESPEAPEKTEEEEAPSEVEARTDELLTRAVRSGMSLKDARTFASQDADALDRQIGLLEQANKPGDEEAEAGESADAEADPLSGIPDLDPEVYDEEIVAVVQALKSKITEQGETIKGLSSGNKNEWFDNQVEALPVTGIEAAQRTELNGKFDVLKKGYAASGQDISDAEVFQQATELVLGNDIRAAVAADKAKRLKRREDQQTQRPGGPARKPKGDPLEEVADDLDRKYFGKK